MNDISENCQGIYYRWNETSDSGISDVAHFIKQNRDRLEEHQIEILNHFATNFNGFRLAKQYDLSGKTMSRKARSVAIFRALNGLDASCELTIQY